MDSSSYKKTMRQLASILNENQVQMLLELHNNWQLDKFFDLIQNRPGIVDIFHTQKSLEEPVAPYLTELEIRQQLLDRVTRIAHQVDQDIHMALFAVLMVAPVNNLQSKIEMLEISFRDNNRTAVETMLTQWREISFAGIQAFVNKESRRSESTRTDNDPQASPVQKRPKKRRRLSQQGLLSNPRDTPASSCTSKTLDLPSSKPQAQGLTNGPKLESKSDAERATWAEKICKQRDGGICYFTGMPNPVAAHIFPLVGSSLFSITAMVEIFWGTASADRLSALINRDQNISESPQNLVSLNRQLHWWFNNGRMALKPLRKMEGGSVTVQLHWLEPSRWNPDMTIRNACFLELMGRVGHFPKWNGAHRSCGVSLETGHTFAFWNSVDQSYLPNFDLLQLSWDLRRVATVCGAYREPEDETCDDGEEYYDHVEGHHDDEGYDDNEGYYDQDNYDVDVYLDTWEENQHALIHRWMGEIEVESGTQEEETAFNTTQSNVWGI
ncbi:hypothetical protein GGI35DRAFT_429655 [Trichoderma velutinum]